MANTYLIVEMIVAALFAILTVALSGKFFQAGFRRWGWMLAGFVLIVFGAALSAAFSVQSFSRLFVPEASVYAFGVSTVLRGAGLVMVLGAVYISVLQMYREQARSRQQQHSLKLLEVIRDTVNQSLSLIELLNFSIREFVRETNSECGCVFIYNPNRKQLVLAAHRDLPMDLEKALERIQDNGSIFFRTQKGNSPHVVGKLSDADRVTSDMLADSGYRSLISVPLPGRNGSFGVLALFSSQAYFYEHDQAQLVSSAAHILGPAVASLRMERDLRDASSRIKSAKNSEKFISGLLKISTKTGDHAQVVNDLLGYAEENLGINEAAVFKMDHRELFGIYPNKDVRPRSEISEHMRRSIAEQKSLLVRTDAEGTLERTLIIPVNIEQHGKSAVVFTMAKSAPDLKPEDFEHVRAVAHAMALRLELMQKPRVVQEEKRVSGISATGWDELNDLNNTLTGILGNAQLLGVSLRKEDFRNQTAVLHTLDKIADEAFRAGLRIKGLQDQIQSKPKNAETKSDLDAVLRSIGIYENNADNPRYVLRDYPSIRFVLDSELKPGPEISQSVMKEFLSHIFRWLEANWQPEDDLHFRMTDSHGESLVIISDKSATPSASEIERLEFVPLGMFPDQQISALGHKIRGGYLYSDDGDGDRYVVFRLPKTGQVEKAAKPEKAKPAILAIDDQEMIRELLESMLDELKYPHHICADGLSGLEAFQNNNFDILITDLGLPDIDGWEVVRKVKALKPSLPVIVISGWGVQKAMKDAPVDLAEFILAKPFRMEQLGELIRKAEEQLISA